MPFTLYEPGTRKNNRYWIARLTVDGRRVEVSTKTTDKTTAREFARGVEREMIATPLPRPGDVVTFAQAAKLYAAFRGLDLANPEIHRGQERVEAKAINRLVCALGKRAIADLGQIDLVEVANTLFSGKPAVVRGGKVVRQAAPHSQATKNRWVIKPGSAILHYAARQKLCEWERIEKFKEKRPQTRAVAVELAAELVAAAPEGPRRLLLVWLFRQGTRITDTLQITWEENIKLARQTVRLRIGKADEWTELPIHPELFELLAAIPETERKGRLFPWHTKSGVYRWLRRMVQESGIAFTPHMARHSVGTWLNEAGAGLRTIMAALCHRDPQSSIRYQTADVDIVRAAARRFEGITGKISRQG
jgi:integrase/uncharacterized ParB-like nuclease family protein